MTDVSQNNRASFSDYCHGSERQSSAIWTIFHVSEQQDFASRTISMVQRDGAPPSERVSLNVLPALRLVLGESTGLFGLGLERSSKDQAKHHFALATSCFRGDYCKTEQGIGLLTISVRQRAANLD